MPRCTGNESCDDLLRVFTNDTGHSVLYGGVAMIVARNGQGFVKSILPCVVIGILTKESQRDVSNLNRGTVFPIACAKVKFHGYFQI